MDSLVKGWIRKGKILQGMQQYSKALSAYQKAMELDPNASVSSYVAFLSLCRSNAIRRKLWKDTELV